MSFSKKFTHAAAVTALAMSTSACALFNKSMPPPTLEHEVLIPGNEAYCERTGPHSFVVVDNDMRDQPILEIDDAKPLNDGDIRHLFSHLTEDKGSPVSGEGMTFHADLENDRCIVGHTVYVLKN